MRYRSLVIFGCAAVLMFGSAAIAHAESRIEKTGLNERQLVAQREAATDNEARLTLKVMLVGDDLSLKPVPRHDFVVVFEGEGDSKEYSGTTSFSGEVSFSVPLGDYRIRSKEPVAIGNESLGWDLPIRLPESQGYLLELSNDNATVTRVAPTPTNNVSSASLAGDVFRFARDAVVTVETELGHGTAFLVDSRGLLLTNDHVVSGSRFFAIRFSGEKRYPARLVHSSPAEDVAVLIVNPEVTKSLPVLSLATDTKENPAMREGDPVFAIGSPLDQERIISQGIVSRVEEGALISDVMIDRGNSGGPLLNADKNVVGINTFGQGIGISGIVRIWKAFPVLEEARKKADHSWIPSATALPAYPQEKYPAEALRSIALSFDFKFTDYAFRTGKFDVHILTPPAQIYLALQAQIEAAKGRQKRRKRQGIESIDPHDPTSAIREWGEYVGLYAPVVRIWIQPRAKATFGSSFGAALLGTPGLVKYRYKSEFDSLKLERGDVEVPFIRMGRSLNEAVFANNAGRMQDAAYGGWADYLPEAFQPPASKDEDVVLEIRNEVNPDKNVRAKIPNKVLRKVWEDFAPMRSAGQ